MSHSKNLSIFIISLFFIIGCNQENEESYNDTTYSFDPPKTEQKEIPQVIAKTVIVQEKDNIENKKLKTITQLPNKTLKTYRVTPQQLDSMNQLTPIYDSLKYDGVTVNYFTYLSSKLGGKPFYAENANQINKAVMEILSTRLNDQTDVVLLIDKTGSMDDDWEMVKKSLSIIMNHLSKYENVRLGIASYGDKNYHLDFWYNMEDLSYDLSKLEIFMDTYSTMGNPDTRESVNDAIVKTVNSMNWNPGSNRIMMVIGDAPSQLPPLSDYTTEEVIEVCESMDVLFNLYPVIISNIQNVFHDAPQQSDFAKFYPNPALESITIETTNSGPFTYEIIDLTGKTILNGYLNSNNQEVDISNLNTGTYLVQIFNQNLSNYYTSKLIKK